MTTCSPTLALDNAFGIKYSELKLNLLGILVLLNSVDVLNKDFKTGMDDRIHSTWLLFTTQASSCCKFMGLSCLISSLISEDSLVVL